MPTLPPFSSSSGGQSLGVGVVHSRHPRPTRRPPTRTGCRQNIALSPARALPLSAGWDAIRPPCRCCHHHRNRAAISAVVRPRYLHNADHRQACQCVLSPLCPPPVTGQRVRDVRHVLLLPPQVVIIVVVVSTAARSPTAVQRHLLLPNLLLSLPSHISHCPGPWLCSTCRSCRGRNGQVDHGELLIVCSRSLPYFRCFFRGTCSMHYAFWKTLDLVVKGGK